MFRFLRTTQLDDQACTADSICDSSFATQEVRSPIVTLELHPNGSEASDPYPDATIERVSTATEAARLIQRLYKFATSSAGNAGQAASNAEKSASAAYVAEQTAKAEVARAEAKRLELIAAEYAKKAAKEAQAGNVLPAGEYAQKAKDMAAAAEGQASIAKEAVKQIEHFVPKKK